jgi:hypothetical protein
MEGKTVAASAALLGIVAILAVTLGGALRSAGAAGDERGQSFDIAIVIATALGLMFALSLMFALGLMFALSLMFALRLMFTLGLMFALGLVLLGMAVGRLLLLARRVELGVARQIGLRVAGAEGHLLVRSSAHIIVALVAKIVSQVRAAFGTEERSGLAELFLRGGNQAEIMLGVLVVIFRRNRVAGRLRITGKLNVFLGNMRRCAADFDVGSVRFIDPGEGIVALAVSPPHTLVLTVSHGLRVRQPLIEAHQMVAVPRIRTRLKKRVRAAPSPREGIQ